jgi:hypothetical protein
MPVCSNAALEVTHDNVAAIQTTTSTTSSRDSFLEFHGKRGRTFLAQLFGEFAVTYHVAR